MPDPTLPVGRASAHVHHEVVVPDALPRKTVADFIDSLGFDHRDVKSLAIEPLEVEVELYVRDDRGAVKTRAGGYPVTTTRTLAVR